MNKKIVAQRITDRPEANANRKEVIELHHLHAKENGGRVLFTSNTKPSNENIKLIEEIILMTPDGSCAIHADVDFLGVYSSKEPPAEYSVPSVWDNEEQKRVWYALSNLKEIKIEKNDYKVVSRDIELLESIGRGHSGIRYIEKVGLK